MNAASSCFDRQNLRFYALLAAVMALVTPPVMAGPRGKIGVSKTAAQGKLRVVSGRIEHPNDGESISHVVLVRDLGNHKRETFEIVHRGQIDFAPNTAKPELYQNRRGDVNYLRFDTGDKMCETVAILCQNGSTKVMVDFDQKVMNVCAKKGRHLLPSYFSPLFFVTTIFW